MRYIIILRRNPYFWGSTDWLWDTENKDNFDDMRAILLRNTKFPDLHDDALNSKGYPGYTYLKMECYRAEKIDGEL